MEGETDSGTGQDRAITSSAPVAAFEGVSHCFGELRALDSLQLEVRAGEVLGLLGPNGAGKTTALRILVGLLSPTEGRAVVGGRAVAEDPLAARRVLGYVPDGAPLYSNLSAATCSSSGACTRSRDRPSRPRPPGSSRAWTWPIAPTIRSATSPTACARRWPSPARSCLAPPS